MQTLITIRHFERFGNVIDKLNRQASKLGFPKIGVELVETRFLKVRNPSDPFELWGYENFLTIEERDYNITSEKLVLSGDWKLIAVFNLKENLVKVVPGEEVKEDWKSLVNRCDHCHINRERSETFLIESVVSGERKIVGRNCLGDFLGVDPATALKTADLFQSIMTIGDEEGYEPKGLGLDLQWFMAFVIKSIRENGFVSKKIASETGKESTSNNASFMAELGNRKMKDLGIEYPTKEDIKTAEETIVWMKQIQPTNDYMQNLKQIAENSFVTAASKGFAASAYSAMMKEIGEKKTEKKVSSFLGKIGEKITAKASLVHSTSYTTEWGVSFFHKFIDNNGNIIIWSTNKELNPNKDYDITAKVTKHDIFRNEEQTYISRPKIEEVK